MMKLVLGQFHVYTLDNYAEAIQIRNDVDQLLSQVSVFSHCLYFICYV